MKVIDTNGSGIIDYTEFLVASLDRKILLSNERLEAAFKTIDKDGSGQLELGELKEIFNPGNQKQISEHVWKELLKDVDVNSDGKISLEEFREVMKKMIWVYIFYEIFDIYFAKTFIISY